MQPLIITKYMIVLTIITVLLIGETNAQLGFDSFNGNIAGDNSLNNNLNLNPRQRQANQPGQPQPGQAQQNPFLPALSGFLLGTALSGNLRYPYGYYPYNYYPYYYYRYYYYG